MAFNSYNIIVEITLKSGKTKRIYCETLRQARDVLSFSNGKIVGNY